MSSRLQIALLRFLQERQLRRVGSNQYVDANVRVIAAVNVDPTELIQEGRLRQDLYFRLNVLSIPLPPLRQRKEDIHALSDVFLREFATQRRKSIPTIDPDAMKSLCAYRWPGNIRELRNIIERAVLLCDADEITLDLLPEGVWTADVDAAEAHSDFRRAKADAVLSFERAYLDVLLKKTLGNVRQAARVAGMPRSSLQRLLRKHKINSGSFRNPLKGEGRETRS